MVGGERLGDQGRVSPFSGPPRERATLPSALLRSIAICMNSSEQ
jgi:hypothetical protein